jgi:hypothetical protein
MNYGSQFEDNIVGIKKNLASIEVIHVLVKEEVKCSKGIDPTRNLC